MAFRLALMAPGDAAKWISYLIQLLNGVQYGLLIFLAASGLTLVFGIMGVINLSHGSFYMLGAYGALTLTAVHRRHFPRAPDRRAAGFRVRLRHRVAVHPPPL
jgi:branched-subunit amino acid ABC-type transport system permease component